MSSGIISEKFIDINKIEHEFPQQIRQIGFGTTLLHNHPHAPSNYGLVYKQNFTISEYLPKSQAQNYYPCSWYLESQTVQPYEFCDQKIQFQTEVIGKRLETLEKGGYKHYGTTQRPIREVVQLETKKGHVYIPKDKFHSEEGHKVSQTALNGKKT